MASSIAFDETRAPRQSPTDELYYSALARDPELADLVELFVQELPARIADMQQAADIQDWQEVRRLAHQIKGAGGSYGFPQLTAAAWQLEQSAREALSASDVSAAILRLAAVCNRVRAGVPDGAQSTPLAASDQSRRLAERPSMAPVRPRGH